MGPIFPFSELPLGPKETILRGMTDSCLGRLATASKSMHVAAFLEFQRRLIDVAVSPIESIMRGLRALGAKYKAFIARYTADHGDLPMVAEAYQWITVEMAGYPVTYRYTVPGGTSSTLDGVPPRWHLRQQIKWYPSVVIEFAPSEAVRMHWSVCVYKTLEMEEWGFGGRDLAVTQSLLMIPKSGVEHFKWFPRSERTIEELTARSLAVVETSRLELRLFADLFKRLRVRFPMAFLQKYLLLAQSP